jgi:hypothetical protein
VGLRNLFSTRLADRSHLFLVVVLAVTAAAFPAAISAKVASSQQSANTPSAATLDADAARIAAKTDLGLYMAQAASHSPEAAESDVPAKSELVRQVAASPKPATHKAPAAPSVHHVSAPVVQQPVVAAPPPTPTTTTTVVQDGYGCSYAIAYLSAHAAPGFHFECPGYADGHQAMTCMNIAGLCPGENVIAISVPCAAAYMNEASNSWVLTGKSDAPIDPYGYCHD